MSAVTESDGVVGGAAQRHASARSRSWALVIDVMLFMVPISVISHFSSYEINRGLHGAMGLLFAAYRVYFHQADGRTPGKRITGARVVNVSGGALSLRQVFIREVPFLMLGVWSALEALQGYKTGEFSNASGLAWQGWLMVGFVVMLMNGHKRSLHDHLAKTIVVTVPQPGAAAGSPTVPIAAELAKPRRVVVDYVFLIWSLVTTVVVVVAGSQGPLFIFQWLFGAPWLFIVANVVFALKLFRPGLTWTERSIWVVSLGCTTLLIVSAIPLGLIAGFLKYMTPGFLISP